MHPIKRKNSVQTAEALGLAAMRDKVLSMAGVTPAKLSALMAEAIAVQEEALTATKTTYFNYLGEVTDERTAPDHATRLKAAQSLIDLGLSITKPEAEKGGGLDVTLNFPVLQQLADYQQTKAEVIDVSPSEGECR